jgi:hypothetical protein
MKLKALPAHIQPFTGRSDVLTVTRVPSGSDPRKWYLNNQSSVLPPCISSSEFVPEAMIEHLMRNKKNSALGVKFQAHRTPPDQITNMEGAMHTFVTPLVRAHMHGDYIYRGGHGVIRFAPVDNMQQARVVIISAQIQPDFEGPEVLLALTALKETPLIGSSLPNDFVVPEMAIKQVSSERAVYDLSLKRHIVKHLTQETQLPNTHKTTTQTTERIIPILETFIKSLLPYPADIAGSYLQLPYGSSAPVLCVQLLFNTAVHQLRNELSALEALCPQGYVYTSDPPSIFAREIGSEILNRLQFAALKYLAVENAFSNMRVFAFNDYADSGAIDLLKAAMSNQPHVMIVSKQSLFKGPRGTYAALPGTEGSLLVIHNNSDAFGQNIETEWETGSMDGAIGANSSAAASLERGRADLISNLM